MIEISVPNDPRGVYPHDVHGFLESVHDAFASEEFALEEAVRALANTTSAPKTRIEFVGNHTVAARILCGEDSRSLWASTSGNVAVKSMITKSGVGLYIGGSKMSGSSAFRKRLKKELKDEKAVRFTGEAHTGIVEAFKSDAVLRCIIGSFIRAMNNGDLPLWKRPWKLSRPISFASGKPYRGVNVFRLTQVAQERGYVSPLWITAYRAEKEGHPVKKGERGTMIVSPIRGDGDGGQNIDEYDYEDDYEDTPPPRGFFCQPVFNLNQCVGLERERLIRGIHPPRRQSAQSVIDRYVKREPTLVFDEGGKRASYAPSIDRIVVPRTSRPSEYYIRAFHQIARSTGHSERCDRRDGNGQVPLGGHKRGKEELIAEMAASLLSVETGLDFSGTRVRDAASYNKGWLEVIRRDPNMLIWASFQATTAVDYILNRDGARKKIRAQRKKKREQERKRKNRR